MAFTLAYCRWNAWATIVIGKTCDDGIWGIHIWPKPKSSITRWCVWAHNFDAIGTKRNSLVWWITVSGVRLAQAIVQWRQWGLKHHAQIYDFDGQSIPARFEWKITAYRQWNYQLRQPHGAILKLRVFGVVMLLVWMVYLQCPWTVGSPGEYKFNDYIQQLAIGWTLTKNSLMTT